jgi:hypothetical protein
VVVHGKADTTGWAFAAGATYAVTFVERGLPRGQSWCVVLEWERCSILTSLSLTNLTPGTYPYAVLPMSGQVITATEGKQAVALSGSLTVPRSHAVVLTYVYPYAVTFTEQGLPSGTTWTLAVGGQVHSNTTVGPGISNGTIVVELRNGTYAYRIGLVSGYVGTGMPRGIRLSGGSVIIVVTFSLRRI